MTWDLFFWHKVWNCCPERYGKFQSEIPSTSGAICEKNRGGPLPPPAGGGGVILLIDEWKTNSGDQWCRFADLRSPTAEWGAELRWYAAETVLRNGQSQTGKGVLDPSVVLWLPTPIICLFPLGWSCCGATPNHHNVGKARCVRVSAQKTYHENYHPWRKAADSVTCSVIIGHSNAKLNHGQKQPKAKQCGNDSRAAWRQWPVR